MFDHEAIRKAYPNIVNSSDAFVNSGLDKDGNKVSIAQTAVDAARVELDKLKYKKDRSKDPILKFANTYPSLADQLDQLYHDIDAGKFGADAKTGSWFVGISSVKAAHPKPS